MLKPPQRQVDKLIPNFSLRNSSRKRQIGLETLSYLLRCFGHHDDTKLITGFGSLESSETISLATEHETPVPVKG